MEGSILFDEPAGTLSLVDPELLPLLSMMPAIDFAARSMDEIRQQAEARYAFLPPPSIKPEIRQFPGPGGTIQIYWYDPCPHGVDRPVLLHIHGGGMIMGSARVMQANPAALARTLNVPVASVEYRLAPEAPFPGPQEDCLAAYAWLVTNGNFLGIDPERIGLIGESAGGGLAAATALMLCDRVGPRPAAQFLIYAMLDHRTGSDECPYRNRATGEFIWTRAVNRFAWQSLRGSYTIKDERQGWFSPILARDLSGLPPTWIGIGSLDLFLDENLSYARRLIDAGTAVELRCYNGGVHAFNAIAQAGITKAFNRDLFAAVSRWLNLEPSHARPIVSID